MWKHQLGALAVLFGLWLTAARAQEDKEPEPPPGGYTPAKLKETLIKLGYELDRRSTATAFLISIDRERSIISHRLSLSPNRATLWITAALDNLTEAMIANQEAVRRLLEENDAIGPARFSVVELELTSRLQRPTPNRDMTPAKLRKEIESLDALVRKTEPLWSRDAFIRIGTVPADIAKRERERFKGNWEVVDFWAQGKRTPEESLKKSKLSLQFDDERMTFIGPKINPASWAVDPRGPIGRIDAIENNRITAGIYRFDGDNLILHFAVQSKDRPTDHNMLPGPNVDKLILKRAAKP